MNIKPEDVKQVLLEDDDFGHEMRVGNILAKLAAARSTDTFNATDIDPPHHGGTYTDLITGKPRQFDYRCRLIRCPPRQHATCAFLAVECKNLHESAPLVISGRPRTSEEAYYAFIESSEEPATKTKSWVTRRADTGQFYHEGEFVGKSLLRLKVKNGKFEADNNSSEIYDRWSQALASAVELANAACTSACFRSPVSRSIILPIVVIPNDSLWNVSYDEGGLIQGDPIKVDASEFFIERRIGLGSEPFVFTHIHFVTLRGFENLVSRFLTHHRKWDWVFPAGAELLRNFMETPSMQPAG